MTRKAILDNPEYTEILFLILAGIKEDSEQRSNEKSNLYITKRQLIKSLNKLKIQTKTIGFKQLKVSDTLISNKIKYLKDYGLININIRPLENGRGKSARYFSRNEYLLNFILKEFFDVNFLNDFTPAELYGSEEWRNVKILLEEYMKRIFETNRYKDKSLREIFEGFIIGVGRKLENKYGEKIEALNMSNLYLETFMKRCWMYFRQKFEDDLNFTSYSLINDSLF